MLHIDRLKIVIKLLKSFVEKLINTMVWLFSKKGDTIVLNVWLWHKNDNVRPINLGDDLNWHIVKYLSGKRIITYRYSFLSLFHPINYMCIGSIVDTLINEQSIIWGSGAMYGDISKDLIRPNKILAVRGPKTRNFILTKGMNCPEIYGDPVILLPDIYPCKKRKKFKLGIIPHMVDLGQKNVINFVKSNKDSVVLIDLRNYKKWTDVIDLINECEYIASSSLHGIIISDAYGIANVWIKLSNSVKGDGFKFYDYFESCSRVVKEPIDFCCKEIEFERIVDGISSYTSPIYNKKLLLESCPFLSESVRQEFCNKGILD